MGVKICWYQRYILCLKNYTRHSSAMNCHPLELSFPTWADLFELCRDNCSDYHQIWRSSIYFLLDVLMSMASCQKGPTRHAYAWQIGPFWQDTFDVWYCMHVFRHAVHPKTTYMSRFVIFVVVIDRSIFPYPSRLHPWHRANLTATLRRWNNRHENQ